ncbi:radical SAM protein (plasmid) [Rhizobium lusitanum]|uniref:B12-binding domain-containing radical SAM protein n=1 Tax=Rhizobium lusitanum TaxID=293958 RepID=UPI0016118FA9|nr:radical SAM protein [Rhizobium lusitanum]QND44437.1 radical SAM protein [Rhizobium lusitanum]
MWSKVFALGRAKAIASRIREKAAHIFLGACSHKLEPDTADKIVNDHYFDCAVRGPSEDIFANLPSILGRRFVPGVIYDNARLAGTNEGFETVRPSIPKSASYNSLDQVASPYLSHVLDGFLAEQQQRRDGKFRAFLSSSRGCQFACHFCSRSVKYEKVRYFSAARFYGEIEYLHTNFGVNRFFVLDDAFLCSKKRLKELKDEFERCKITTPSLGIISLYVMARPESMDVEVIEFMSALNVRYLQIGLQTINPALQHFMGRPIDVAYFREIKAWLDKYKIALQLDVILGFPGDTVEWMIKTVTYATSLDPASIQLKQLYLNPFTAFHVDQLKHELATEEDQTRDAFDADFDAPYVVGGRGLDERYYVDTNTAIMEEIQKRPDIRWKYLSKRQRFVSTNFYPGVPKTSDAQLHAGV